ncbi:MAG: CPBP family intramembrane metalloprotease [Synergistaceae bacterium]|jgi:membrane protease YdiL (CAAX protease family)|nr:CPBP family intramembrane metalloprotease [Synergistaceae bacterium]
MIDFPAVLRTLAGLLAAAFMLYFPYVWLRRRGELEEAYGLRWFMGEGAWRDVFLLTTATLVPLTFLSLYWPRFLGVRGPFRPGLWNALNMLGGGLAAAFIEETFYRGWLQTLLLRRWSPWFALPVTSLLFALSHLFVAPSWLRLATFFPGLVMGFLRYRHNSVLPAILYHAICNVWSVWWMPR